MSAHPYYAHRHRVTLDETNLVGNVYFAHYLRWQGHCRENFLADHAPGVIAALASGLALVTLDCSAEFFAEGQALDVVEIRMRLDSQTGHRLTMSYDYVRTLPAPEILLARGTQSVAVMERGAEGLRPVRIPDELTKALDPYRFRADGGQPARNAQSAAGTGTVSG
ncbi:acyl-CoA thioesterase [Kineosporia sp. NBRC 101731]|uniref:acyl-CoA thioesterase n=1 Tax=Kineosporia sp. NBRC 101731 TaxID=3032199 RepID=UPI0024A40055|nr:acyl-CoA thioesterase [Kineosporia sp. NBRC 101731]GLY30382.1 4-hydroxybenzoyl-CoA thioesterase [Kineosporia sp. NBRC 101731]